MISPDFSSIQLKLQKTDGKTTVFDPVRRKWVVLTPEEHVRQYMIAYLRDVMRYPPALMAVEKMIMVGGMSRRFDIVVYDREKHEPWMLIECKAPDVMISEAALHQLLAYQRATQCHYWILTNGHQNFCADVTDVNNIRWLDSFPGYSF